MSTQNPFKAIGQYLFGGPHAVEVEPFIELNNEDTATVTDDGNYSMDAGKAPAFLDIHSTPEVVSLSVTVGAVQNTITIERAQWAQIVETHK